MDRRARSAALQVCSRYTVAYIDAVIPLVTEEYARERDRWLRSCEQRRMLAVREDSLSLSLSL